MDVNNTMAVNLIANRGNRCTATLLTWIEREVYPHLSHEMQRELRSLVLDQVNGFKDLAMDVVKSDTAYLNELWVQKLDEIHRDVRRLNGQDSFA
jgi:hypothetical protein